MSAPGARQQAIEKIRRLPQQVEGLVSGLSPEALTARPLAGEWTVAQNVHHLVDSHINSYVRCKLMATEENPTLKPYDEAAWARLADGGGADLSDSLTLLKALQACRRRPGSAPAGIRRAARSPSPGSLTCTRRTAKRTWNRFGGRWPRAKVNRGTGEVWDPQLRRKIRPGSR